MADEEREVLTDKTVRDTLGLESGHRVVMVLIGNVMYKKDNSDGYWYRLQGVRKLTPSDLG